MSNSVDDIVALALEAGAVTDDSPPAIDKDPTPPTETKRSRYVPEYEKNADPYVSPYIRKTAEQPYGVLIMEDRLAQGLCTPEELEATKFFAGSVEDQLARITDAAQALEVLKVFGQRKLVTEEEVDSLARIIAEKEVQRHTEEAARIEEEARAEREQAEQEAMELHRQQAIEDRIISAYTAAHRSLLPPE